MTKLKLQTRKAQRRCRLKHVTSTHTLLDLKWFIYDQEPDPFSAALNADDGSVEDPVGQRHGVSVQPLWQQGH